MLITEQIENAEPTTEEAQSRKETAVVTPISSASNEIVSHDNTDSQPQKARKSLKNTGQGTVLCLSENYPCPLSLYSSRQRTVPCLADSITHIGGGRFNKNDGTRHRVFIVFEPEQVKSAESVTYDNDGNVIPLSERFNEKKSDIRFSKKSGNEKLNIDHAEKSSYNGSKNKNGGDQNDGNRVAGEVDRGRSEGREVRTAAETGRNVGRGYQVPDRVDLSQSLNKAFEESGVVATELYDYSGDSAAYSSALDAARNADDRTGDG